MYTAAEIPQIFGVSLMLTLVVELVFVFLMRVRNHKDLMLVALANMMTNPPIVAIFHLLNRYTSANRIATTILLEGAVILTEAEVFRKYGRSFPSPFLIALFANLLSYSTGFLLVAVFL